MIAQVTKTARPSLFWALTDAGRAIAEFGMSLPFRRLYGNVGAGDNHPVLVLPGFMAGQRSTKPLRKFLARQGYTPYDWGLGRNYGDIEYKNDLLELVDKLYNIHGEPVSIIGWSLGGVFARELGKERPDRARQIITLGSPFQAVTKKNNASWIYEYISGGKKVEDIDPEVIAALPNPAPIPTTAIYSKEDGVVPWQYCMERVESPIHQNVRVRGSHLGLGINPSVLHIIADRLQYDINSWEPFESNSYFQELLLYPSV